MVISIYDMFVVTNLICVDLGFTQLNQDKDVTNAVNLDIILTHADMFLQKNIQIKEDYRII